MSNTEYKGFVVIPARNESENLPVIISSFREQDTSFPVEIVVADNNSTDNTAEVARSFGAQVVPAPVPGIGPARQAALDYVLHRMSDPERTIIIQTDADCQAAPGYTRAVFEAFAAQPAMQVGVGPCIYTIPLEDGRTVILSSGRDYKQFTGGIGLKDCFALLGHDINDYVLEQPVYYLPGPNTTYRASLFTDHRLSFPTDRRWEMIDMSIKVQQAVRGSQAIHRVEGQRMEVSPRAFLLDSTTLSAERLKTIQREGLGVFTPDSTLGTRIDTVRAIIDEHQRV